MESPPRTSRAKNSPSREALGSIPWLAEVSEPTLDALAAHAMLHRLPAGSMAFEQAETPAFALFLVSGSLKLLGVREQTEAVIDVAQPFDLVLPAAVIADQPYLLRARSSRGRAASADRRGRFPGRHGFRQRPLSRGAWVRRHAVAPTVAGREELSPPLGRGKGRGLHRRPESGETRVQRNSPWPPKRAKSHRISA